MSSFIANVVDMWLFYRFSAKYIKSVMCNTDRGRHLLTIPFLFDYQLLFWKKARCSPLLAVLGEERRPNTGERRKWGLTLSLRYVL